MSVPKNSKELEAAIRAIDAESGPRSANPDPTAATSRRLDLILELLLEVRNNLRGY
jgi:hypothetical protein